MKKKRKKVRVYKDEETGECYIKIRSILYGTGIKVKDVFYYKLELSNDSCSLILELYDKSHNNILKRRLGEIEDTSE